MTCKHPDCFTVFCIRYNTVGTYRFACLMLRQAKYPVSSTMLGNIYNGSYSGPSVRVSLL